MSCICNTDIYERLVSSCHSSYLNYIGQVQKDSYFLDFLTFNPTVTKSNNATSATTTATSLDVSAGVDVVVGFGVATGAVVSVGSGVVAGAVVAVGLGVVVAVEPGAMNCFITMGT